MAEEISIREFARRDGCSDSLVRRAIKHGDLKALASGRLDASMVGSPWRKEHRRTANTGAHTANISANSAHPCEQEETPSEVAERIIAIRGATMNQAEAERVKENYLALLRQLEYDQKSGAVVDVVEVAGAVGKQYAAVRTRLLAIPAEQAPAIYRCKTVAEVQALLLAAITEALEELTYAGTAHRE